MSSTSDVVRLRKFNGTREDYPVFLSIFEALCGVKKCAEALDPGFASKLPGKESNVTTDADQIEAKKQNAMAMSLLTFFGTCYNCGKDGHRAVNCKEDKKSCKICGKKGA